MSCCIRKRNEVGEGGMLVVVVALVAGILSGIATVVVAGMVAGVVIVISTG